MDTFSKKLKYEREQAELTKRAMAKKLGIPESTYTHYERLGKENREPSLDMVVEIAKIFDVSVDYLLGRED